MELRILPDSGPVQDFTDPRWLVWHDPDGRICAYVRRDGKDNSIHIPEIAEFFFSHSTGSNSIDAVPYPNARHDLIQEAYQRVVLPMVLQARGNEVLHASAVCVNGGVVAFCADSGTGKSTTAYAMTQRGYPAWADDAMEIEISGTSVHSVSLPYTIRLFPETAKFLAARHVSGASTIRRERLPVKAVFLLDRRKQDPGPATADQLSSAEAVLALLKHAWCFSMEDVERKKKMMQNYLEFASRLPVYRIEFASGLDRLAEAIDCIEKTALTLH